METLNQHLEDAKRVGASANFISYADIHRWQDNLENYKIIRRMDTAVKAKSGNPAKTQFAMKLL
jgi:hypothetical protein